MIAAIIAIGALGFIVWAYKVMGPLYCEIKEKKFRYMLEQFSINKYCEK